MSVIDLPEQPLVVPVPRRVVDVEMSDGAIVRLRQHGQPGRRRLALSHGNGLATNACLPFWGPLGDDYELIVFDMRNHGENPLHDPSAHTWPRLKQDMGEIHAGIQLHFGEAPTIGAFHSLSAVAAVMSELDDGPRWAALALFDPPIFPRDEHPLQPIQHADMTVMTERAASRPPSYDTLEQFVARLRRQPAFRRWVPGSHRLLASTTLRPEGGRWILRNPRELEADVYRNNIDPTVWPRMVNLRQPTILIAADPACPDASPPARICRAIHDELGIDYAMIPDTSHFLQIEEPESCRRLLNDFIARHRLA